MKKIITIFFLLSLTVFLTGCGDEFSKIDKKVQAAQEKVIFLDEGNNRKEFSKEKYEDGTLRLYYQNKLFSGTIADEDLFRGLVYSVYSEGMLEFEINNESKRGGSKRVRKVMFKAPDGNVGDQYFYTYVDEVKRMVEGINNYSEEAKKGLSDQVKKKNVFIKKISPNHETNIYTVTGSEVALHGISTHNYKMDEYGEILKGGTTKVVLYGSKEEKEIKH